MPTVLLLTFDRDADAVQTLLVAAALHRSGAHVLRAVLASGPEGAALARAVLDRLGATDVPVGVGSSVGLPVAPPPDLYSFPIDAHSPPAASGQIFHGGDLLARVISSAVPRSLTLVCAAASLRDVADAIAADPERAVASLAEVSILGGLKRLADRSSWMADSAPTNLADEEAAAAVYAFCFARCVPMAVVSPQAVPEQPLQLARSFAARSGDALPALVAKAQERTEVARLSGCVRPASLVPLVAVLRAYAQLMPSSEPMVEGPHRLYLRQRQAVDVAHLLPLLRNSYHEAILLASGSPARRGVGIGDLLRGLWPAKASAGAGARADGHFHPNRAEPRMRATNFGLPVFVARVLGPAADKMSILRDAFGDGSEQQTQQTSSSASASGYGPAPAQGLSQVPSQESLQEYAPADDGADLTDAAQWRLSMALLVLACLLIGGSVRAQLAAQTSGQFGQDVTTMLRSDLFGMLYLLGAVALMLALPPTRAFLGLVRVAAVALALVFAFALSKAIPTFVAKAAQQAADAGVDWVPYIVLPTLGGSLCYVCHSLWRHGSSANALSYSLFFAVGFASLAEVFGVLIKRTQLGWTFGSRDCRFAVFMVVRTVLKGALSGLLPWPHFRATMHSLLASALTRVGASPQPLAPLAPLVGYGSCSALLEPEQLVRAALATMSPARLNECAVAKLLGAWEAASPAGSPCPTTSTVSSGYGPGQNFAAGGGEQIHFVVHSRADAAADKAGALLRWARAQPSPPLAWVDEVPSGCADVSLHADEQLAFALAHLGLCPKLVVLAGPALLDSLWAVTLLHAWSCLGRSLEDVALLLAVPTGEEAVVEAKAAGRAVLEAFDAFAVMYARADAEGPISRSLGAQLMLAVELASASAYNEAVRACVPLVHAQLDSLDAQLKQARELPLPSSFGEELSALGTLLVLPVVQSRDGSEHSQSAHSEQPTLSDSSSDDNARPGISIWSSGAAEEHVLAGLDSSDSEEEEEPCFVRHLRVPGAGAALVAAFDGPHASFDHFVPLSFVLAGARSPQGARYACSEEEEACALTTPLATLAPPPRRRPYVLQPHPSLQQSFL
ncbi:hypothetical protein T492DRAFT_983283 [Pavlovales sp. CCMP2436]|nr:hypothetical protein T492DRAFT_983283 [Pavlovales sp. CCMP2436]